MENYILGIDQSTQGTKALLFDDKGNLISRTDLPHRQIIDERGWVEHDPEEILKNTIHVVKDLVKKNGISKEQISGIGISNQRETAMVWDRESGRPIYNAVVWQCARGEQICRRIEEKGYAEKIRQKTGLRLSPYFSAAKIAWILQNVEGAREKNEAGKLCIGTMDSWLVYKLTKEHAFKTDYSNASRTQLFNITDLCWDNELCQWFGVNRQCLPKVCGSDELFGMTDLDGYLDHPIPIHGVLGDSHGALFGQGCTEPGMIKVTYGTGSSIMMNIGEKPVLSDEGIVTSLAYKIGEKVNLERAMAADGRFGGHIVAGHIDGTGMIEELRKEENAVWVKIRTTPEILELIVEKGSICIDGISLTVAEVNEKSFQVSVIPHTGEETTLLKKKAGDRVNLENDIVGKYIKKFLTPSEPAGKCGGLTMELLEEYGI